MTKRIWFSPLVRAGVFSASLGLLATGAHATEVPFSPQPPISVTADQARSVFAADVDGDGDLDALSASVLDGKVAWYENTAGNGSAWTLRTISTAAVGAHAVFAADVDGDGDLDALSASTVEDKIAWYENTAGNGSAWTLRTISTAADFAQYVVAADVDGDGDLDALSASRFDDKIAWYENTAGNGTAWTARTISTAADGARSVVAADVDRDGDMDALSASSDDGKIAWYENTAGNGTAWSVHTITTGAPGAHFAVAADIDGDGDLDAVQTSFYDDAVSWYENTAGDGSAWALHSISTAADGGFFVLAADVDGDGDKDVVSASYNDDKIAWYENAAGDGTAWIARVVSTAADGALAAFAADLDRDGDLDVMSASTLDDEIAWYRNDTLHGGACFGTLHSIDINANNLRIHHSADLDRDGDADVLSTQLGVSWHENTAGDGSLWTEQPVSITPVGAYSVSDADVDGDGDRDVLVAGNIDSVAWHENLAGDGSAWAPHTITTAADGPSSIVGADFDGDGDADVLTASFQDDRVAWHENSAGDGSVWVSHVISTSADSPQTVFAADVDGDGDVDALSASNLDDKVAWYENTAGDGSAWTTHTITTSAPFALGVHAADVDGDGDVDVLSTSGNDSTVEWHENVAGNGSVWVAHAIDTAAQLPFSVVATDLDRDGDVDAVAAWLSGRSVWYENTVGNGSAWTMHTVTDLTGNPFFTSAADLDGDGREDVIESQYFDQQLVWYQGLGGQFSLTSTDTAPPTADNSALVSMLRIDAAHLGRAGDRDLELASLGLLFEEAAGDPLTSAEANALVESLRIYRDANGSGVFEPAVDVLVASLADLTLAAGVQTVAFADGDANLQVGVGAPRTYFVVVELTANASQQSPNQLRVTHLGLGPSASSAEDRDFDIVLRPACPADVSSSIRQAVPLELFRFTVE